MAQQEDPYFPYNSQSTKFVNGISNFYSISNTLFSFKKTPFMHPAICLGHGECSLETGADLQGYHCPGAC